MFPKNFCRKFNLADSGTPLPVFSSATHLKIHSIPVTPKFFKKIINNLDLSRVSGPDCIPVVVLKNCEPELSFILAELFNICLKDTLFLLYNNQFPDAICNIAICSDDILSTLSVIRHLICGNN